jgi:hypothetical protein
MMTPQEALESAISDYAALNHGQVVSEHEMAEHIIKHMLEHYGYEITRAAPSQEVQHD